MIKKIMLVVIMGLILVSCNKNSIEQNNLKELIESDKDNNKKSVFWDGTEARIIDDSRDDDSITEGRFGLRMQPELVEKEDWSIRIDTFNNAFNTVNNENSHYKISSFKSNDGLQIECEVTKREEDYDSLINKYSKEKENKESKESEELNSYGIKRHKIFIEYPKESERISLIAIIESIDKNCYEIRYSGYGNVADVFGLAYNTFNSFEINIKE